MNAWSTCGILFAMPGPMELLLIFMVALLLFGAKRLPEIAKGLGDGIREFKKSLMAQEKNSSDRDETKN